jgi:hypothetical protein
MQFSQLQELVGSMNEEGEPSIKYRREIGYELQAVASDADLAAAFEGRMELKLFVGEKAQAVAASDTPQAVAGIHVRAITHFIVLTKDESAWSTIIVNAAKLCADCAKKFTAKGYEVQTLRLVCNPFGEYLDTCTSATALAGMDKLKAILSSAAITSLGIRIRFACGAATTVHEVTEIVPALIQGAADLANCCVNIPCDELGLPDDVLTQAAAQCCMTLAKTTARGEGNFNFTANYNMPPGCPYFPAGTSAPISLQVLVPLFPCRY